MTSLASTSDSSKLISGGEEGMVRVWRLGKQSQTLEASMKDHRGSVNAIRVRKDDAECVSASSDGSCIIWDLATFKRRTSLFANTFFKSVVYHPDESQLVTTGTDRKVMHHELLLNLCMHGMLHAWYVTCMVCNMHGMSHA